MREPNEPRPARFRVLILVALVVNAALLVRLATRPAAGPPPRVALVLPEGVAPVEATVLVVLTAPVLGPDPATWPPATGLLRLVPPVPGATRWLGPDRLAFRPAGPLPAGRAFRILVSRELGSWLGTPLAGPCEFSFRTPPPPEAAPAAPDDTPRADDP